MAPPVRKLATLDTDEDHAWLYSNELWKSVRIEEISSRGKPMLISSLWAIYLRAFSEATAAVLGFWEELEEPFTDLDESDLWKAIDKETRSDLKHEIDYLNRSSGRRLRRRRSVHPGSTATGLRPFLNTLHFINAGHDAGLVVEDMDDCPGALSGAYPDGLPSGLGWGLSWGFLDRLTEWFVERPTQEREYAIQSCFVILTVYHLTAAIEELVDEADALIRQRMERGGGRLTGPPLSADRLAAIMEIEDWQKIQAVGRAVGRQA